MIATNEDILAAVGAAVFEFRLQELRRAYDGVMGNQAELRATAEKVVRERWGLKTDEEPPGVTHEDDGAPTPDFWEDVWESDNEAETTSTILRQSFVIALFHFWEKHTNRWLNRESYSHETVMSWLRGRGYSPQDRLLKDLEMAANCAKHGPGRSCLQCYTRRPDLFDQASILPAMAFAPDADNMRISDAAMVEFFDAVQGSGLKQGGP